ncbi:helix-turn-helix domain-containing protein [Acidovorax sp. LjRoot74]|uniref:helix-turn-helix transcriptional regulator n=1 Tax=Acidovorax sp. LjRoot74 TaxID=3342337 RepID=UPI003ED0246C
MPIDSAHLFDDTKVASYLKHARAHHDLTLEQLSRLTKEIDPAGTGVSRVALSRYENGASLPGLRELRLISFATRRPLALLFYGERTDPMSSYRLELEMRITDIVMGQVDAQGLIKEVAEQAPDDETYKALLERVKASN